MSGGRVTPPSRGGAAIQAHVEAVDGPTVEWFHPRPSKAFAGAGPVEAVGLHRAPGGGHWHLVTYGLSELHAKESDDRHLSGWGFELTFRVASEDPPLWAVDFLASMAAYVWSSRHPFAAGHLVDLRGPVKMDSDSPITAAVIVEDPALGRLDGPFGAVHFLQIVGLHADELELCRAWSAEGVVELLGRSDPMLVTDLYRPPVTDDPERREEIEDRTRLEGSSLHELRIGTLEVKRRRRGRVVVQLGSGAAAALGPALRRELLGEGATFTVVGDDAEIRFSAADRPSWKCTDTGVSAVVALDGVEYVAGLFDGRTGWGRVSDWPGLRFHVVP